MHFGVALTCTFERVCGRPPLFVGVYVCLCTQLLLLVDSSIIFPVAKMAHVLTFLSVTRYMCACMWL